MPKHKWIKGRGLDRCARCGTRRKTVFTLPSKEATKLVLYRRSGRLDGAGWWSNEVPLCLAISVRTPRAQPPSTLYYDDGMGET